VKKYTWVTWRLKMKLLLYVIFMFILFGCAIPGYQHCPVDLTQSGSKIPLLGATLVSEIPGRPLAKCSVLAQIRLFSDEQTECWFNDQDLENALRNRTAETMGNVAIFVKNSYGFLSSGSVSRPVSIQGMALFCPPESLNSAGISNMIEETIKSR
jgi:hypothetical protein